VEETLVKYTILLFVSLFLADCAVADFILQPASVSTSIQSHDFLSYRPRNMRNKIEFGFTGPSNYTSGATDFTSFTATAWHSTSTQVGITVGNTRNWLGALGALGDIDFDLGQSYQIRQVALWTGKINAVTDVEYFASPDSTFTSLTSLGRFNYTGVPGGVGWVQSQNKFLTLAQTQHVRMRVYAYNTDPAVGGVNDNLGMMIGEVAFGTVPEPNSAGLLALGCAFLTTRLRRRRRSTPA